MSLADESILDTTKKNLGVADDVTVFDVDILTHINSVFFTLNQIGVGPSEGFMIQDKQAKWSDYIGGDLNLNVVKTYIYARVRVLFDPPTTSFAIDALKKETEEFEWRLQAYMDGVLNP